MKKLLGSTLIVLLLGGVVAGVWWAWPVFFPSSGSDLPGLLSKADSAIVQGKLDLARSYLKALGSELSATQWLRVHKRVWQVSNRTGQWKWAADYARTASLQYPGNDALKAFHAYVQMKIGVRGAEVQAIVSTISDPAFAGLKEQANVEAQVFTPNLERSSEQSWRDLREVLLDPKFGDRAPYRELTRVSSDPYLKKNALLSSLMLGNLSDAQKYMDSLTPFERDRPPFDHIQAFMAYDRGEWKHAATLIKNMDRPSPQDQWLLADVFLKLKEYDQAELVYRELRKGTGRSSGVPMVVNLASLALLRGHPELALEEIARFRSEEPEGAAFGLGEHQLKLLGWEARYLLGETQTVIAELQSELAGLGDDTTKAIDLELLRDRLKPAQRPISRLWALFHKAPHYSPLAERLVWALIETADYEKAFQALQLHEKRSQQTVETWVPYYRALLLGMQGRSEEAFREFERVPGQLRDYSLFFNWALLEKREAFRSSAAKKLALLQNSIQHFNESLNLFPSSLDPERRPVRSIMLTQRAETRWAISPLLNARDRPENDAFALNDVRTAVELDSDNLRAAFLLRRSTVNPVKDHP